MSEEQYEAAKKNRERRAHLQKNAEEVAEAMNLVGGTGSRLILTCGEEGSNAPKATIQAGIAWKALQDWLDSVYPRLEALDKEFESL